MAQTPAQQKRAFGQRLTKEMLDQGYAAKRARIKADAAILQKKTGVKSLEMARRYIKGESMPEDPKIIKRICDWLNVREAWLLRGELPKTPTEQDAITGVDSALLAACLEIAIDADEKTQVNASPEALAKIAAYLYLEQINGEPSTSTKQIHEMLKLFSQTTHLTA